MSNGESKKSQEKVPGALDLDLDEGLGELEFESTASETSKGNSPMPESPKGQAGSDSFFELDSLFEAELENANAEALDLGKGTQKTIFYDRSKVTSSDVGAFSLDKVSQANDLTKSSSEVLISRPDIEFTVKDILVPKSLGASKESSADKTQEMNLSDLMGESNEPTNGDDQKELGFDLEAEAFSLGATDDSRNDFNDDSHGHGHKDEDLVVFDNSFEVTKEVNENELNLRAAHPPVKNHLEDHLDKSHPLQQRLAGMNTEESARIQGTLRQLREEREGLLDQIKLLKGKQRELEQDNLTLKAALDESKIEVSILRKRGLTDIEDLNYRLSLSEEKKAMAEEKARAAEARREKLEQRVRIDFNQVKQREKELESKLEMLSVDVDSQVQSRDQKILELRRKIDGLEFNMENISIKEKKTQEDKRKLEDKLNKMMKTLRHSMKNLEDDIDQSPDERQDEVVTGIRRLKA